MNHADLTPDAIGVMTAGLFMICLFFPLGCSMLDTADGPADLLSFSRFEKLMLGVEWLLVFAGINMIGVASPYDWSFPALVVMNIGLILTLVSMIVMHYRLEATKYSDPFPIKGVIIDLVVFFAGMGAMWLACYV